MKDYTGFEIAVIGMAGRFPGANNVNVFWENIKNGIESVSFFNEEELLTEGEHKKNIENPNYVNANAYLKDKEYFDSNFFGYLPLEAKLMDPQMRILHECVWQVIEDGGYDLDKVKSRIGLFLGASSNLNWENFAIIQNDENLIDDYSAMLLSDINHCSTRISYLLNLRGPSIYLNTACSTSLIAIHQACNSLLLGECNMAIAGGVNIKNYSKKGYLFQEGMIFSKDGHCRPFDEEASGIIGGEGVGLVLLKKLKNAIKDEDNIYAVIKGTGANNDGHDKVGYTAPSVDGQTEAIMMAQKMGKVPPASITYIEAHGTATNLGDPIEVEALTRAFGKSSAPYCALGSVKSNIGHLDTAAGIAGFIKTVLALKHRQLPPSLNFTKPNPRIDFNQSPFYVNTGLKDWHNENYPLRAGVSSFGIGGTNAHVVLEEAPEVSASSESREQQLLLLSAKTPKALERNIENLRQYLLEEEKEKLADIAYTLQVGRTGLKYRKALVVENRRDAIGKLEGLKTLSKSEGLSDRKAMVAFLFSGQGAQYVNMCRDLYETEAFFRKELDHCFDIIEKNGGENLRNILFAVETEATQDKIHQTEHTQPILFSIEYALTKQLMHWGIQPDVMLGHSIGEYTAACISGVFSLEDALKIVAKRGALMQKVAPGKMLSVSIDSKEMKTLLTSPRWSDLDLATINSSENCVVGGTANLITTFQEYLEESGYVCRLLKTSHAFHSRMMDVVLVEFEAVFKDVIFHPMGIPFISNVSGGQAIDEEISKAKYWVKHLRNTVNFADGIGNLLKNKHLLLLEVGPGKTLTSLVNTHAQKTGQHKTITLVRHPKEKGNDLTYLLTGLGSLWCQGVSPEWANYYESERRKKVSLPGYSFEQKKYPALVNSYELIAAMTRNGSEMKTDDRSQWFYTPTWKLSHGFKNKTAVTKSKCTLFLSDGSALAASIKKRLKQTTKEVVVVYLGEGFKENSEGVYELNPADKDQVVLLYESLKKVDLSPDRLIHGWGLSSATKSKLGLEYDKYMYSLLHLVQTHHEHCEGSFFRQISLLGRYLWEVFGVEEVSVSKTLAMGMLKVLPQEFPTLRVNSIDVGETEAEDETALAQICEDLQVDVPGSMIAYRHHKRWERFYDKIAVATSGFSNTIFKTGGVYLITGAGQLALTIAEYLLVNYEAKVLLTGRRVLPDHADWEALSQAASGSEKHLLSKLLELEQLKKGELLYLEASVTDEAKMTEAIAQLEEEYGALNGVFHTAGLIKGATINVLSQLTKADFEAQLSPKVKGLSVLAKVLENKNLDFCLLTSSLSAILGGLRFGAYGTANSVMDEELQGQRRLGKLPNWVSVNLDALNFEGGAPNANAIDKTEIMEVLTKAIEAGVEYPQVIVSVSDLQSRVDQWISQRVNESAKEDGTAGKETSSEEEDFNVADDSMSAIEKEMMKLWQVFFGKTDISLTDSFFEIGGDSLKALTMIQRIKKAFDVELTITDFFEKPSIELLSKYIEAQQWLTNQPESKSSNKIEITI